MPGPTTLITPNDSSIGSHTSTRLCNKIPISYNGVPQIHPPKLPLSLRRSPPHLIHSSLDWPHAPSQMAPGSTEPCCHKTLSGHTDQPTQTVRWDRQQVSKNIVYARYADRERIINNANRCFLYSAIDAVLEDLTATWSSKMSQMHTHHTRLLAISLQVLVCYVDFIFALMLLLITSRTSSLQILSF